MRNLAGWVCLVLLGACGEVQVTPDAAPDAPVTPDAAVDAPPFAEGTHYRYVVSRELIPTNNNQAREFGMDLNGDLTVDNQLGMVLGTLASMGFNTQVDTNRAIDRGDLLTLIDLQTNDFVTMPNAGFTVYDGAMPQPLPCLAVSDAVCRRHLAGTGTFTLASTAVSEPALVGPIVNGTLTTSNPDGRLHIQLVIAAPMAIRLPLHAARVKVSGMSATGVMSAVLAGAVTETEMNATVFPAIQQNFMSAVVRDCTNLANPPGCGCVAGSTGKTALDLFDGGLVGSPKNCAISVAEVRENSLIQSLFAPDLTLPGGQQALSVGIKVEAVPGTFTP